MKNSIRFLSFALLALASMLFSTGCTTTGTTGDRSDAITSAVLELAGTSFTPVLANNPRYVPVAQAVVEALGTLETGTINAETIRSFVGMLAEKKGFTPEQRAYAELLTSSAWTIYTAKTGLVSANLGNANTKAWISAFRRGLTTAITLSAPTS